MQSDMVSGNTKAHEEAVLVYCGSSHRFGFIPSVHSASMHEIVESSGLTNSILSRLNY